jgi:hypothetical protein
MVEHLRKPRHVLRGVAIGVRPWEERGRRGKVEFLARGRATELLEEREEVRSVLGRDVVAADALVRGVLPTFFCISGSQTEYKRGGTDSKSRPSRSCFLAKLRTVLTNAVRFAAFPTSVENQRPPVQPPIVTIAFTPCCYLSVTAHVFA